MTPQCAANLRRRRIRLSGFGDEPIPCGQTVALRSFIDYTGQTRWYCAKSGHRFDAERRFGVREPEPEWLEGADPVTAAKGWQENERRLAWGDR